MASLLESFPSPPTFIPSSPNLSTSNHSHSSHSTQQPQQQQHLYASTNTNIGPPPSRPPAHPLPPVPGPSRISEHDASAILSRSSRSRDSVGSQLSTASISTLASGALSPPTQYIHPPLLPRTRSRKSTAKPLLSVSVATESAYGGILIEEEPEVQLTRMRMSISPMPTSDIEDDIEQVVLMHQRRTSKRLSSSTTGTTTTTTTTTTSGSEIKTPPLSAPPIPGLISGNRKSSAAGAVPPPPSSFNFAQNQIHHSRPLRTGSNPTSPTYPPPHHPHSPPALNENSQRLSDISMHDLPPPESDSEGDFDVPTTTAALIAGNRMSATLIQPSLRRKKRISAGDVSVVGGVGGLVSPKSPTFEEALRMQSPVVPRSPGNVASAMGGGDGDGNVVEVEVEVGCGEEEKGLGSPTQVIHRQVRSKRSKSRSHRDRLNSVSGEGSSGLGTPRTPGTPQEEGSTPSTATPRSGSGVVRGVKSQSHAQSRNRNHSQTQSESHSRSQAKVERGGGGREGAESPDIQMLLEATPRPSRSRSVSVKRGGRGRRRERRPSAPATTSNTATTAMNGTTSGGKERRGRGRVPFPRYSDGDAYDRDEEEEERIGRLERELEGFGSDRSGSRSSSASYSCSRSRSRSREREGPLKELERVKSWESQFGRGYVDPGSLRGGGGGGGGEDEGEGELGDGVDVAEEEGGGSESDSSLDLHTPLPNLMLRDGVLSPNSKLLPGSTSVEELVRPGSMLSLVSNDSVQTKSGIWKDSRDTPSRRLRHKDGRLLRGGIGLTTGLGWSDSEDEDAPSPLTRRLSSLNLSRKSSTASLRTQSRSKSFGSLRSSGSRGDSTSRPPTVASSVRSSVYTSASSSRPSSNYHPLSRNFSSRTLDGESDMGDASEFVELNVEETFHSYRGKGKGRKTYNAMPPPPLPPPTSWSGRSYSGSGSKSARNSSASTVSLAVSIPDSELGHGGGEKTPKTRTSSSSLGMGAGARITRSASEASSTASHYPPDEYNALTPSSTASSVSIPLPVTPRDDEDGHGQQVLTPTPKSTKMNLALGEGMKVDKDKVLPPLPNPRTGSIRRPTAGMTIVRKKSSLRSRSGSASDGTSSITSMVSMPSLSSSASAQPITGLPLSTSPTSQLPQPPRQLQLPRLSANGGTVTNTTGQIPVPVPGLTKSGSANRLRMPSSTSSPAGLTTRTAPSTPVTPNSPPSSFSGSNIGKPKPRTGTGMVYRSSSSGSASGLRMPLAGRGMNGAK